MPEYRRGEDGMQLGRSDDPRHRHDDRYRDQHGRRSDGGERQRDENARSDQGRHSGNEPYGDARYGDRRYGEERYGGERYRDERDSDYRYDLPRDEGRSDDRDRNYAEGRSDDGNAAARRYDALGYGEGRGRERDDMSWNRGRYTDTGEYENAQFAEDLNRYEGGPRRRIDDRDTRGPSKR